MVSIAWGTGKTEIKSGVGSKMGTPGRLKKNAHTQRTVMSAAVTSQHRILSNVL
jgi:hypothetical protein